MSHDYEALHRELRAIRRTRHQLEPMVLAGPPDAQERWEGLEKHWSDLESRSKSVTRETGDALGGVAGTVRDDMTELRQEYERLASTLREPRPHSLWGQVRTTFERLVDGGQRTTQRVASSVEGLADAAKVRILKERLARTRAKKCAELGTRVYDLATRPGRAEGGSPQVLDDDQVTALLQDLASLDADIRNAAPEFLQPDRVEA